MKYTGEKLKEISFPLGGIGSGSIGLGGDGRLIDWEIFNRPDKGSRNGCSHLAVKVKHKKKVITKILNGDINKEFIGRYKYNVMHKGFGFGPDSESLCGFPHFRKLSFKGEFPIAQINFSDDEFPANVKLTAFNPFIPLDDKNSSLPAAFFEVEIKNDLPEDAEYEVALSLQNPFKPSVNSSFKNGKIRGVFLKNAELSEDEIGYGDLTIATDSDISFSQTYWYRGEWQDSIVSFWNDFNSTDSLKERSYSEPGKNDVATIVAKASLMAGEKKKFRLVLTWNIPNNYNYWGPYKDKDEKDVSWKNYYAVLFKNSKETAEYALNNWDDLFKRTDKFRKILHGATLDKTVIDAISSNLSVLKSATVLRLQDGSFYGWEGVQQREGSCFGTCQHVWNYAYALCFLFPNLERSIRDAEMKYALYENGQTEFRLYLPYGRDDVVPFRACVDGQMGTIFKMYREWKISGDTKWLNGHWENIKKMLEYSWSSENKDAWDPNKEGVLTGRQHHTLDVELFGPSSWLMGMYALALTTASEMAKALGEDNKAKEYEEVFNKCYKYIKENLFNGKYFIQQVDLTDKKILEKFDAVKGYWNEEKGEIKYQIKDGSIIDQMLAQWHADLLSAGSIYDEKQKKTALKSLLKNNYKERMRDFINPWRIFSANDESGTVMCDYPEKTVKPAIPIPYCEETMTGFEYALAGLLVSNDMIDDGIKLVRAVRERYDGEKRNPYNEMECGSNYARSMASFALLPIFSGFSFDMTKNYVGFNPKVNKDNFMALWSLDSGWGSFKTKDSRVELEVEEGFLELSSFGMPFAKKVNKVRIDGKEIEFKFKNGVLTFEKTKINDKLIVSF